MNNLNLYTHTQFGDHCVCFGLVKELAKEHERITLYTKPNNEHFLKIKQLYSSIPNVIVSPAISHFDLRIECDKAWYEKTDKWYKHSTEPLLDQNLIFDRYWYNLANVPFEKKWDNFYFERDMNKEKNIFYNQLKLTDNDKYIFMQDDASRNFVINREYLPKNIRIIESSSLLDINILDMLYIVEKALEVHVNNSSFLTFIDLMNIKRDKLFYHKYTRNVCVEQPGLRLNWQIIE